jgi:hypothetical protein
VEHVMEVGTLWQLKLVCDVTNVLKNLERPVEFRTQLPATGSVRQSCDVGDEATPNLPH